MNDRATLLCGAMEELTVVYEEILGRAVAKKWAIVAMDMPRLNRLVEEQEVLATECRAIEKRRQSVSTEIAKSLGGEAQRIPALSDLIRGISLPALKRRTEQAARRLRGVLAMLRRVVEANREIIAGGMAHFEKFFRVIQQAGAPRPVVYSPRGTVAVRDRAPAEYGLCFVDRQA